jgi:solute carrier family 8 (sodium/calcium exchanger)
VLGFGLGL